MAPAERTCGIKRRRESIEMYAGKRDDLAQKERDEVTVLEAYLPPAVSDEESSQMIMP